MDSPTSLEHAAHPPQNLPANPPSSHGNGKKIALAATVAALVLACGYFAYAYSADRWPFGPAVAGLGESCGGFEIEPRQCAEGLECQLSAEGAFDLPGVCVPKGTMPPDRTAGWKVFTDVEHGVELRYPENWAYREYAGTGGAEQDVYFDETDPTTGVMRISEGTGIFTLTFSKRPASEVYVDVLGDCGGYGRAFNVEDPVFASRSYELAGKTGWQVDCSSEYGSAYTMTIVPLSADETVVISTLLQDELHEQILSTLRFPEFCVRDAEAMGPADVCCAGFVEQISGAYKDRRCVSDGTMSPGLMAGLGEFQKPTIGGNGVLVFRHPPEYVPELDLDSNVDIKKNGAVVVRFGAGIAGPGIGLTSARANAFTSGSTSRAVQVAGVSGTEIAGTFTSQYYGAQAGQTGRMVIFELPELENQYFILSSYENGDEALAEVFDAIVSSVEFRR